MYCKVSLLGYLGSNPEPGPRNSCKFSLATRDFYKGEEKTYWWDITVWGKQAETCLEYLAKGRCVSVHGKMTQREGNKKTFYNVEAYEVHFVDSPKESRS